MIICLDVSVWLISGFIGDTTSYFQPPTAWQPDDNDPTLTDSRYSDHNCAWKLGTLGKGISYVKLSGISNDK